MKTFFTMQPGKAVLIFAICLSFSANLFSQPQYYNYNSGGTSNSFPFNIVLGKQIQVLFLPGDFNMPTPAPGGNITSVGFRMGAVVGPWVYTDVVIKMGQTSLTSFDAGQWYTGQLDTCYYRASVTLSAAAGSWLIIDLDRLFLYDPTRSLVIDVQQCGVPGATGFSSLTTTNSGFRRNTSLVNTGCPFVWGQQSGTTPHMGVNIAPAACTYSWVNQTSGTTQQFYSVKAVSDQIVWAAGANATVRRTTNGGTTWTDANPNPGVISGIVYAIEAIDADNAWCTTSPAATFIFKTTNGGVNWVQVFTQTGGFINGISFSDANNGFAEGDPVGGRWSLWKTSDAGTTWDSAGMYLIQAGTEAGWNNSVFRMGNTLWFGTNNTKVYYSTNGGSTWSSGATTGLVNSYNLHFNNATTGLAGGTAIVKTTDGGVTYASVGTVPGTGNINGIEGKNDDFWYVRGTGIFRSSNAGSNWTQVHTSTGTLTDIDFPTTSGCLVGWAVGAGGYVGKMTGTTVGSGNITTSIPDKYILEQNYPNPFNPVTTISYELPAADFVTLKIFDVTGRVIEELVNMKQEPGRYNVNWDAVNFSSGTYFYKLTSGDFVQTKKMILLK